MTILRRQLAAFGHPVTGSWYACGLHCQKRPRFIPWSSSL